MKTCFLMAAFLVGSAQATIKITHQQAETFFRAIALNSHQQVELFFERIHARYGFDTVVAYANLRNPENQTPLHLVSGPEMFETLLRYRANLGARDSQGRLPLLAICLRNDPDISRSILRFLPQFLSTLHTGNSDG